MKKIISFAMYCTAYDQATIEEMYRDWDSDESEHEEILSKILRIICDENDVEIEDVKGKRKNTDIVIAKREYCYFACRLTNKSLKVIGAEINKDHATVLYHKNKIESWLNIPAYHLSEKLNEIETKLKS